MSPRHSAAAAARERLRTASAARHLTALTLLSRMLGYVRDMLIAWVFGTGMIADAFIAAFRIPNLTRRLFGEGAFSMGFIPVYTACRRRAGDADAHRLAAATLRMLVLVMMPVMLVGLLASPWVVRAMAPGYLPGSPVFALTVALTRIMWPYVFFAVLVALLAAVLNAQGHFTAPALAPIGLNLVLIATLLGTAALALPADQRVRVLAAGVVLAGVVQLVIQLPALRARRIPLWRPVRPRHRDLGTVVRMALPSALGTAALHINILIGTLLASFLASGSISSLFFADRLIQFPLGLFAVSAATALMPGLSRLAAREDWTAFNLTLQETLSLVWFMTLPAITGLVVLRTPIVQLLLERGAFGSNSTRLTSEALLCYGTGLWAHAGVRIAQTAFFAMRDARTPLKIAGLGMGVNLLVGAVLMHPLGHRGVALGTACAAVVNLGLLLRALQRRRGTLGGQTTLRAFITAGLCSLLMGLVVSGLLSGMQFNHQTHPTLAVFQLLICVAAGVAVYGMLAWLCRSRELAMIVRMMRNKTRVR